MKTISLNCANCGAPLVVKERATTVTCDHCRAKLGIKYDEGESPRDSALESPERKPLDESDAPSTEKPRARTEVLEVVKAGVEVIGAGVKVVDRVSNVLFWTKVTVVAIVVICVCGCCVVPSLVVFGLFRERFRVAEQVQATDNEMPGEQPVAKTDGSDDAGTMEQAVAKKVNTTPSPMDQGEALAHWNDPDPQLRERAEKTVRRLTVDPELLVRRCLVDLDTKDRKDLAIGRLTSLDIDATLHESVVVAVRPLLRLHQSRQTRIEILDVLQKCFPSGIPATVEAMQNLAYRREAAQRLRAAGPQAETFVWVALEKDDSFLQREVCQLLADIGTERSIPRLKSVAQNADQSTLINAVRSAIGDIVAANRKPVDVELPSGPNR